MRKFGIVGLVVACAGLFGAGSASGYELTPHTTGATFDGTGATAGAFGSTIRDVAVDQQTGYVYVLTGQAGGVVDKFDSTGLPIPFSAPSLSGASSLNLGIGGPVGSFARIAVDNSGTATQGRIYVSEDFSGNKIWAFNPDGSSVTGFPVSPGNRNIGFDPASGNLWLADYGHAFQYLPDALTSTGPSVDFGQYPNQMDIDPAGNLYLETTGDGQIISKFNSAGVLQYTLPGTSDNGAIANDEVNGDLYSVIGGHVEQFDSTGSKVAQFGSGIGGVPSIAVDGASGKVYVGTRNTVGNPGSDLVHVFDPGGSSVTLPDISTGDATDFHPTDVTLHGTIDPHTIDTNDCHFEWSTNLSFNNSTDCSIGHVVSGDGDQDVSVLIAGLKKGTVYHYRLVSGNVNGPVIGRQDKTFVPSAAPSVSGQFASDAHSDGFTAHATINPGGADTTYAIQYGPDPCSTDPCTTGVESGNAGSGIGPLSQTLFVSGLNPGTTYYYRIVATNQTDSTPGPDQKVTTFPYTAVLNDPCDNAHVRQQTGAALLPDCRAYELVSAPDTGGYNVESDLVGGQDPFGGYPDATGKALYGVHSGAIPGPWNPTNHGVDPYVATRGANGWNTDYVGMPADNPNASGPFSSSLLEADPSLDTFAFGGPDICSPCFADNSSGYPLHLPNGDLTQGLTGSTPDASATPAATVRKHFSGDGHHFLFATTAALEGAANSTGTDATIYERNLSTDTTEVVSTLPDGSTIANGDGVAELDVSHNGSRVVIGKLVSTDSAGNHYYHLYMHIAGDPDSIDLTPGASHGVLYDGMSADGTKAFFTATDRLTGNDTDASADIYRASVGASSANLSRVSIVPGQPSGGTGDTDSCDPVGHPDDWNVVSGIGKCGAVAFAGGAGVATGDGSFYFLSPEMLDTSNPQNLPVQDEPNLYVSRPGSALHFVTTIDSSAVKPVPTVNALTDSDLTGATISNLEAMTVDQGTGDIYGVSTSGKVYRFDSSGLGDNFTCVPGPSCSISTNQLTGFSFDSPSASEVAIDNSGGVLDGDIYVADFDGVHIFDRSGVSLGDIATSGFAETCGVAVDQSNGDVYVADFGAGSDGKIVRYRPLASAGAPLGDSNYVKTGITATGINTCELAADGAGHVYASSWSDGPVFKYNSSAFAGNNPSQSGTQVDADSNAIAADPISHDLYVNEGDKIAVFDPSGNQVDTLGSGDFSGSRGVAVSAFAGASKGFVYADSANHIAEYGLVPGPVFEPIDNPAIVRAVRQSGTHTYGDFQVTPDGNFVSFASVLPLSGYDNDGHYEVFRYDAQSDSLGCASCNPTDSRGISDASLPDDGLGLASDGKVFFNSDDALAPRDLDNRRDAYEWEGGAPQLISTGKSPFDSSLLGVSADGTDAFFFTKDTLVPQDANGTLVKLYDARADGGFAFVPAAVSCKASDECHGAGSPTPPPPNVSTGKGSGGNQVPASLRCKHGKVKRHGRCVAKPHKKKHHKRRHHKRAGANRGGAK